MKDCLRTSPAASGSWARGKLLGDTYRHRGAVTALLDRLLHHAHVLQCGPRSWRTTFAARLAQGAYVEARDPVPERLEVAGFQTITGGRFGSDRVTYDVIECRLMTRAEQRDWGTHVATK
jgi:hypothetical protein